jgi:hypothetical protein
MHIKIITIILDKENLLLLTLAVVDLNVFAQYKKWLIEMTDLYLLLFVETNAKKKLHQ